MFPARIFDLYKELRRLVTALAREDSLRVIWAYTQFLQVPEFKIPLDIEVDRRFYDLDVQRAWINEWLLLLLAKEVLLHSEVFAKKGASLRQWKTLADVINRINKLESEIYGEYGSPDNVLVELIRIAHRTFEWQGNGPHASAIVRYYKILGTPEISRICLRQYGVTIYEMMACCTSMLGHFLGSHSLRLPLTSQIAELPMDRFNAVFKLVAEDVSTMKATLRREQKYDESFAYAYSPLRARPVIFMGSDAGEIAVCPIPTLLFWRFTSGLYYDFIRCVPEFANLFGDSFQAYVGEAVRAAAPSLEVFDERVYKVFAREKRSVDWIVCDSSAAALFIECKVKRMTIDSKQTLTDTSPLEADISHMASAVVQIYKTIQDCIAGCYPHYKISEGAKVYPCVVTLENWHMHGPVMYGVFREQVKTKMASEGLPESYLTDMPYSVWPIDDFEIGLSVMNESDIAPVMDGKLRDSEMQDWEWRPYLSKDFKEPRRLLFEDDYRKLFSNFTST